jgi:hypothetical protein
MLYLMFVCLVGWMILLAGSSASKDADLMVLRHAAQAAAARSTTSHLQTWVPGDRSPCGLGPAERRRADQRLPCPAAA